MAVAAKGIISVIKKIAIIASTIRVVTAFDNYILLLLFLRFFQAPTPYRNQMATRLSPEFCIHTLL
jgi:hypothetical protein